MAEHPRRTFVVPDGLSPQQWEIYQVVLAAHNALIRYGYTQQAMATQQIIEELIQKWNQINPRTL